MRISTPKLIIQVNHHILKLTNFFFRRGTGRPSPARSLSQQWAWASITTSSSFSPFSLGFSGKKGTESWLPKFLIRRNESCTTYERVCGKKQILTVGLRMRWVSNTLYLISAPQLIYVSLSLKATWNLWWNDLSYSFQLLSLGSRSSSSSVLVLPSKASLLILLEKFKIWKTANVT